MTSSSAPRSGAVSDGRPRDVRIWRRPMGGAKTPSDVPVYRADLYSHAAIRDPYPHYAALRPSVPSYGCEAEVVRDSAVRRGEGGAPRRRYIPFRRRRGAEHHLTHRRQAELSDDGWRRARPRPKALGPSADTASIASAANPDRRLGRGDGACGCREWQGRRRPRYRVEASAVGGSRPCRVARRRPRAPGRVGRRHLRSAWAFQQFGRAGRLATPCRCWRSCIGLPVGAT